MDEDTKQQLLEEKRREAEEASRDVMRIMALENMMHAALPAAMPRDRGTEREPLSHRSDKRTGRSRVEMNDLLSNGSSDGEGRNGFREDQVQFLVS